MKISWGKQSLAAACLCSIFAIGAPVQDAQAANWLALQGTERSGAVGRAKVWGFIQPEAQLTDGSTVPAGKWKGSPMQPNLLGPDRAGRASFNIRRARIGVRGQGFPLDNKVNYFFLAEYGHNGINVPGGGGGSVYLTDASVTLNHIPYARVRVGQFKTPGSEEGLQAIHVFDYINFTNLTDQLLLERFADGDGSGTVNNATKAENGGYVNKPNGGVGAFRDVGVQLFDTIKFKGMEYSYAGMIGNGNGINRQDNNGAKDIYGYFSAEKVFGGKGARREGFKAFAWFHKGKRTLTEENNVGEHDRDRSGIGFTFRKNKYRAAGEYVMADGLIRNGTDGAAKPGSKSADNIPASLNYEVDGEADGWYIHGGYMVMKNLELDFRYDVLNRITNNAAKERVFSTATFGAQYFLNKKTRLVVNYEMRDAEAPDNASADKVVAGIDDRMSVQLLAIF